MDSDVLILFWQFTIKTLGEIDIVSNQNLSIEMFLLRLIHLKVISPRTKLNDNLKIDDQTSDNQKEIKSQIIEKELINQIKNVAQEKKLTHKLK